MRIHSLFITVFVTALATGLAGCAQKGVSVVSSTSNSKPYVHATSASREKSYVSALESAKSVYMKENKHRRYGEYALEPAQNAPAKVDTEMERAFMAAMMQNDSAPEPKNDTAVSTGVVGKADDEQIAIKKLWGKPPTFLGDGVTIMNKQIRKRFNDAIATTPLQSKVEWRYGKSQFIFMPNSEIYQPFYSGGNCRDGVFIHFDGEKNDRTRALFCQQGAGSDWFIDRK